ncbi:MAG TPA: Gfo/Idh/MocA family oxidoreductase [Vicinamibacterales bacterium]|nr:Gfo/Idh/MocA family oxidoreductase [Vicinamibacterales bacterium]
MPSHLRPTRRSFIRSAGATAATVWVAGPHILRAQTGEKLRIAIIGCGGQGRANLKGVSAEHIAALCDVDRTALDRAAEQYPQARKEVDFRRLFDHAGEFDAVVISVPEHAHAFATLPALELKKHVYCEKPLTYNVEEARIIREAAARAGVATQMGTQIHAGDNYRRVVELVQGGAIGRVSECHVWVGRAWGWHVTEAEAREHKDIVFVQERPTAVDPVPATLEWDLWLGAAPARPFNNVYVPGPKWYRWWDFGNGTMSDLGSHWIDLPFWALKLRAPSTIEASGPAPHNELAPASMQAKYEYKASGDQPDVTLTWYQGTMKPELWTKGEIPRWQSGALFVGDKGMLLADYRRHVLLFGDTIEEFKRPPASIPKSLGHHAEWIHACKTGAPTTCHFEYAGWLTEANHLGNVAFRAGKKLEWDAAQMRATNAPEADPFLKRSYRSGWKLA